MSNTELIDKNELIRCLLLKTVLYDTDFYKGMAQERNDILQLIQELPEVDIERHGRWNDEVGNVHSAGKYKICSQCGKSTFILKSLDNMNYNYCPNCGAKMDGDIRGI